jgi:antitoxin (DNA-binding transcriptional repressor) of toxin-antitoxin stability system
MSMVGVKELRNCLTQYLRLSKQGEEVIVRPISKVSGKPISKTIVRDR